MAIMAAEQGKQTRRAPGRQSLPPLDPHKLILMRERKLLMRQEDLANAAGLSRSAISHLESGRRQPNVQTWKKLCKALNCTPEDLTADSPGQPAASAQPSEPRKEPGNDNSTTIT